MAIGTSGDERDVMPRPAPIDLPRAVLVLPEIPRVGHISVCGLADPLVDDMYAVFS
jgi:hypothetical protein